MRVAKGFEVGQKFELGSSAHASMTTTQRACERSAVCRKSEHYARR